jgi:hypothetical protein
LHFHTQAVLENINDGLGILDNLLGILRRHETDAQDFWRTRRFATTGENKEREQQYQGSHG